MKGGCSASSILARLLGNIGDAPVRRSTIMYVLYCTALPLAPHPSLPVTPAHGPGATWPDSVWVRVRPACIACLWLIPTNMSVWCSMHRANRPAACMHARTHSHAIGHHRARRAMQLDGVCAVRVQGAGAHQARMRAARPALSHHPHGCRLTPSSSLHTTHIFIT